MSSSYDEASLAPEETTDSFWEARLGGFLDPGDQTAWLHGGPGSHSPKTAGLAPQPLGPLQSPPRLGQLCHEAEPGAPLPHSCPGEILWI